MTKICLTPLRSSDDSDPSNSKPLSMTTFSATGHSARVFGTATGGSGSNRRRSLSPSNGSNDSGGGGGKSTDVGSGSGKAGVKNGPAERFLGGNKFQVGRATYLGIRSRPCIILDTTHFFVSVDIWRRVIMNRSCNDDEVSPSEP